MRECLPLQLSREQLVSFIRLYDDPGAAAERLVPLFLDQPFSQPKAVFLQALQSLRGSRSDLLQAARQTTIAQIKDLKDPVLDLCVGACSA
jgi:hypothetical protein